MFEILKTFTINKRNKWTLRSIKLTGMIIDRNIRLHLIRVNYNLGSNWYQLKIHSNSLMTYLTRIVGLYERRLFESHV